MAAEHTDLGKEIHKISSCLLLEQMAQIGFIYKKRICYLFQTDIVFHIFPRIFRHLPDQFAIRMNVEFCDKIIDFSGDRKNLLPQFFGGDLLF